MATAAPNDNLYTLLGISPNADTNEIRKAYLSNARRFHPDKVGGNEDVMRDINSAYEILKDPKQRQQYNLQMRSGSVSENPVNMLSLMSGKRLSDDFRRLLQQLQGESVGQVVYDEEFTKLYAMMESDFIKTDLPRIIKRPASFKCHSKTSSPRLILSKILAELTIEVCSVKRVLDLFNFDNIFGWLYTSSRETSRSMPRPTPDVESGKIVNIYDVCDFYNLPAPTLKKIAGFICGEFGVSYSSKDGIEALTKLLPTCSVLASAFPKEETGYRIKRCEVCNTPNPFIWALTGRRNCSCGICGLQICTKCVFERRKVPRFGFSRPVEVCQNCSKQMKSFEAACWADKAATLASAEHVNCNAIAFCLGMSFWLTPPTSKRVSNRILSVLQNIKHRGMALAVALELFSESEDNEFNIHANTLLAGMLTDMARHVQNERDRRALCELASHFTRAADELSKCNKSKTPVNTWHPVNTLIDRDYVKSVQQKTAEFGGITADIYRKLKKSIQDRDIEQMFSVVCIEEESSLKAAIALLIQSTFSPDQRESQALLDFLKGIYYIRFCQHDEGMVRLGHNFLKNAYWTGWLMYDKMAEYIVTILVDEMNSTGLSLLHSLLGSKEMAEFIQECNSKELSKELQWSECVLIIGHLSVLRKYENAIMMNLTVRNTWNSVDVAFAFIDMISLCEHPSEVAFAYMCAAKWMLKALQSAPVNIKQAYMKLIFILVEICMMVAHNALSPPTVFYCAQACYAITREAGKIGGASAVESKTCLILLKTTIFFAQFCPLWSPPNVSVSEAILCNYFYTRLHLEMMKQLNMLDKQTRPIRDVLVSYSLYANDLDDSALLLRETNNDSQRTNVMVDFMKEHNLLFDDVKRQMTSPLFPRDSEGWFQRRSRLVDSHDRNGFSQIHGLIIDKQTNEISLLVDDHSGSLNSKRDTKSKVIWWNDVAELLSMENRGGRGMYFSLDPPDESFQKHPFQQFTFEPKGLHESLILDTLFHTDYLLKQFVLGIEVSAKPPFPMRRCSKNGLLRNLPECLVTSLRSICEREQFRPSAGRFWIHANELEYKILESDKYIAFLVGDVTMSVKYHKMIHAVDGKLVDSTLDDDDDDCPEKSFCKDFTTNYNKISEYFPEFRRLRELSKLDYIIANVFHYENALKERILTVRVADETLQKVISAQKTYDSCCKQLREYYMNGQISDDEYFRTHLPAPPTERQVHEILVEQCRKQYNSFRSARELLSQSSKTILKSIHKHSDNSRPLWVPAVIYTQQRDSTMTLVYGGVSLCPEGKLKPDLAWNSSNSASLNAVKNASNYIGMKPTQSPSGNPTNTAWRENTYGGERLGGSTPLSSARNNRSRNAFICQSMARQFSDYAPLSRGQKIHKSIIDEVRQCMTVGGKTEASGQGTIGRDIYRQLSAALGPGFTLDPERELTSGKRPDMVAWSKDKSHCIIVELKTTDAKSRTDEAIEAGALNQAKTYSKTLRQEHPGVIIRRLPVVVSDDRKRSGAINVDPLRKLFFSMKLHDDDDDDDDK